MTIEQIARQGLLKTEDYIPNFKPDVSSYMLDTKSTGYKRAQKITTETLKFQFAGIFEGKALLISDCISQQRITLVGRQGLKNGQELLKKLMTECYSSKRFEAEGFILTEEIYNKLKTVLGSDRSGFWLDEDKFVSTTKRVIKCKYSDPKGDCYRLLPAAWFSARALLDSRNNIV